jgi:hypothetical protein
MMDKTTTRIQKKISFFSTDLQALEQLYAESKLKGGLGMFIASRLLGKTSLKVAKSGGHPVAAPDITGDGGGREKKSHKITFRCTARQYQVNQNFYTQSKAKQLGDFFVRVLEKGKVERVEQRALPAEQLLAISRIGHNMNQIARRCNALDAQGYHEAVLREIQVELQQLSDSLKQMIKE